MQSGLFKTRLNPKCSSTAFNKCLPCKNAKETKQRLMTISILYLLFKILAGRVFTGLQPGTKYLGGSAHTVYDLP